MLIEIQNIIYSNENIGTNKILLFFVQMMLVLEKIYDTYHDVHICLYTKVLLLCLQKFSERFLRITLICAD